MFFGLIKKVISAIPKVASAVPKVINTVGKILSPIAKKVAKANPLYASTAAINNKEISSDKGESKKEQFLSILDQLKPEGDLSTILYGLERGNLSDEAIQFSTKWPLRCMDFMLQEVDSRLEKVPGISEANKFLNDSWKGAKKSGSKTIRKIGRYVNNKHIPIISDFVGSVTGVRKGKSNIVSRNGSFVRGFNKALSSTVDGVVNTVINPVETAEGIVSLFAYSDEVMPEIQKKAGKYVDEKLIHGSADDRSEFMGQLSFELMASFIGAGKLKKVNNKAVKTGDAVTKTVKVEKKITKVAKNGKKVTKVVKTGKKVTKVTRSGNKITKTVKIGDIITKVIKIEKKGRKIVRATKKITKVTKVEKDVTKASKIENKIAKASKAGKKAQEIENTGKKAAKIEKTAKAAEDGVHIKPEVDDIKPKGTEVKNADKGGATGKGAKGGAVSSKGGLDTLSESASKHSNIGDFTVDPKTGKISKMKGGGHGQANIDFLEENGIEYNIVKTYDNGVRVGNVPSHKVKAKRTGTNQAWFPESWSEADITKAGEYVGNLTKNKNVADGVIVYGEYNGVRVGVIRTDGKISTVFPDATCQPQYGPGGRK